MGNPGRPGNVLVIKDTVAAVGNTDGWINSREINGRGLVLSPGFIDLHAHGDPLGENGGFENFLYQGVTTVCLGMDGFSPENISGWIREMGQTDLSTNVMPFIGHSTIREISGTGYTEFPLPRQLQSMNELLEEAFKIGYFGLSTGLEYLPGSLAKEEELHGLAKTVGEYNGLVMSHVRNEDDDQIEKSLNELIGMGTFCPVHVSHIKVVYGKGKARADELLQLLDSARNAGIRITADMYPYTASYTGIGILFPDWAKPPHDYESVKKTRRKELEDYLYNRVMKRNGPEATLLGTEPWRGMTLAEAAASRSKPFVDLLIDDIGRSGVSGAYFIMDEELQTTLFGNEYIALASDGSPTMNHPRGYGSNAKVISDYVVKDSLLTLEEAVYKMTGLPAKILGLEDRGNIRVGQKADLVLFDPVNFKAHATYENPHETATGITMLLINGKVVIKDGRLAGDRFGKLILKER